jgi:dTDP-L-rhamnose 4-epimerase
VSRILITGGAGFIGSHLANELILSGYSVRVLDALSNQVHGEDPYSSELFRNLNPKIDFIHGDVCSLRSMPMALSDIDIVIHLAAETGTGQSMYEISKYAQTNVMGTSALLESILLSGKNVKKIIVSSTRAVYGEGKYVCKLHGAVYPKGRNSDAMKLGNWELRCLTCGDILKLAPTDEDSQLNPQSIYGITKLAQEQMILTFAKTYNLSATALRLQNVYGPGQSLSNPYTGILSVFSTRILNNSELEIFEDGEESRDFVYISDVIEALLLVIKDDNRKVDVYNLGSGISTSVLTIAKSLIQLLNPSASLTITGKFRTGDIRHNIADVSKFEEEFGFTKKVTTGEGLPKFASWVQSQPIKIDNYEKSITALNDLGLLN